MTTNIKSELMATITTTVIEAMKSGTAPWQKPWQSRGSSTATNLQTKNEYRGLNRLYLTILSTQYESSYWCGYGQAKKMGGQVRKGEKGTQILAPMIAKDKKDPNKTFLLGFKPATVFNIQQCDIAAPQTEIEEKELQADLLDQFVLNTGAQIEYNDQACFIPSRDIVGMPDKNQFHSEGGYYGTLLHELTHWTGHKSRLARLGDKSKRGYAFEELVAELGAYFASERLGCPNESENHASYLESWLKALQSDEKYLFEAASLAEKAATYLIDLGEGEKSLAA